MFSSRIRVVVGLDFDELLGFCDVSTSDELFSFNEFIDWWRHWLSSGGGVTFFSSIVMEAVGSGSGEEFFIGGTFFGVEVADEEESFDVDVEEFFNVDADDDESSVVDVVEEEFFIVDVDEDEFSLDDVADDWIFESTKSGFDDVTETGSEDDDNDELGRLLLTVWDFAGWCICSSVTECFEDGRDICPTDDFRKGMTSGLVWSCSVVWSSNVCFHSFDVEHSRIGGGGIGDGTICRGKTSVKNPPSPVSLEDAEFNRLVLFNANEKLNGELWPDTVRAEFIYKAWVDDSSFSEIIGRILSDKEFNGIGNSVFVLSDKSRWAVIVDWTSVLLDVLCSDILFWFNTVAAERINIYWIIHI
jgi:hypothetical protein